MLGLAHVGSSMTIILFSVSLVFNFLAFRYIDTMRLPYRAQGHLFMATIYLTAFLAAVLATMREFSTIDVNADLFLYALCGVVYPLMLVLWATIFTSRPKK